MAFLEAAESKDVFQGAIVERVPWGLEQAPLGIVLTAACDLEHQKASFVLIGALKLAQGVLQESKEWKSLTEHRKTEGVSATSWRKMTALFDSWIHNKDIQRYFFLRADDPLGLDPMVIDFQQLIAIPFDRTADLTVVAKLPPPFREKLISHLSAYLSRIGVERDPDTSDLVTHLAHPYVPRGG